jgi:hypothetical protein
LKTQQHAHPSIGISIGECVQRFDAVERQRPSGWDADDGAKIDPVLHPGAHCVLGLPSAGLVSVEP